MQPAQLRQRRSRTSSDLQLLRELPQELRASSAKLRGGRACASSSNTDLQALGAALDRVSGRIAFAIVQPRSSSAAR